LLYRINKKSVVDLASDYEIILCLMLSNSPQR